MRRANAAGDQKNVRGTLKMMESILINGVFTFRYVYSPVKVSRSSGQKQMKIKTDDSQEPCIVVTATRLVMVL